MACWLLSLRRNMAQQRFLQVVRTLGAQPPAANLDWNMGIFAYVSLLESAGALDLNMRPFVPLEPDTHLNSEPPRKGGSELIPTSLPPNSHGISGKTFA